jgi:hypothetical protein
MTDPYETVYETIYAGHPIELRQGERCWPKAEWVINGITVTMTAEPDDEPNHELKKIFYVFRMGGSRVDLLEGWAVLERMMWLNKLEREQ